MAKILIYSKDPCPYCDRAVDLLNSKGIPFDLVDLTDKPDELIALKNRTGWKTVPQIFINGKLIGGFTDLAALETSGELEKLLAE